MTEILLYSALIMLASLVGVFSVWKKAGKVIERNLSVLVSFSAGVFVIIAYRLGVEVVEHAQTPVSGLIWVALGVLAFWLLFKVLPASHHHHDEAIEHHSHSRLDARRIMTSDALHNLADGILLAASFAVSSSLGMFAAISVFIHELVQEMSEFFVLRQAGYSTRSALFWNLGISTTILLGAVGGFFLLESFEAFEVPLLGLACGAFLVVVFHDLIPHSVKASRDKNLYRRHASWFLIGTALMFVVTTLFGH